MRENRTYGSEGGESGSTGLPYPYPPFAYARDVLDAFNSQFNVFYTDLVSWCGVISRRRWVVVRSMVRS